MTRRTATLVLAGVLVVVAVGFLYTIARNHWNAEEQNKVVMSLLGADEDEVVRHLGDPWKRMGGEEYVTSERAAISSSFRPEAPEIRCDTVLLYQVRWRLWVYFLKRGIVVHIYTGLT